jgi:hypothetical protein
VKSYGETETLDTRTSSHPRFPRIMTATGILRLRKFTPLHRDSNNKLPQFAMVDVERIELSIPGCRPSVFPLALHAHWGGHRGTIPNLRSHIPPLCQLSYDRHKPEPGMRVERMSERYKLPILASELTRQ